VLTVGFSSARDPASNGGMSMRFDGDRSALLAVADEFAWTGKTGKTGVVAVDQPPMLLFINLDE
jgi:hypothetical protein